MARRPARPQAAALCRRGSRRRSRAAPEEGMAVRYDFDTPEPPKLRAGIGAGRIVIETAETAETVVEVEAIRGDLENLKVEQHGRDIIIETRRRFALNRNDEYEIHIRAPHRTDADLNVASAD